MLEVLEPSEEIVAYRCSQCSHQSARPFQLEHHIQRNHKEVSAAEHFHAIIKPELYHCTYCGFKSYCKVGRYEHCTNEHDARNDQRGNVEPGLIHEKYTCFPCGYCSYKGHSSISLLKHQDLCKMELKDPILCVTISNGMLVMPTAESKTSKKPPVVRKQKSNEPKKSKLINSEVPMIFQCTQCPHKSKNKSHLKRHVMVRHAAAEDITWFYCCKCWFRSKQKSNLAAHELQHAKEEEIAWYNCLQCSYRAKHKGSLTKHMLVHATSDQIEWFSCTECSFRAKRKGHLKSHMLNHAAAEEIVWFDCLQCPYRAKQKGSLMIHMLKHVTPDDVEWFNCTHCSYRSRYSGNLKKHMLIHAPAEEIKWFQCPECSYRGKFKAHLKTHMLRHAVTN